jgi:hypothetical protein
LVEGRRNGFIGKEKGLELNEHDRPFLRAVGQRRGLEPHLKQKSDVRMHCDGEALSSLQMLYRISLPRHA